MYIKNRSLQEGNINHAIDQQCVLENPRLEIHVSQYILSLFSPLVKRLTANFLLREISSRKARATQRRGARTGVKGLKE